MNFKSDLAIDANKVARRFGSKWVLRGVSLQVRSDEVVGLLGANGSGKTTMLRILATLLKPSAGSATIYGRDVVNAADEVRRNVGILSHAPGLYDDLTARENLRFAADMSGLPATEISSLLDNVGLAEVADDRVRGFSSGMQRRLAIARLMLRRPRVLLLDEPYSNLDSDGIALMNTLISRTARDGGASLVILHELAPAAGILYRTVTIVDGRIAGPEMPLPYRSPVSAMGAI